MAVNEIMYNEYVLPFSSLSVRSEILYGPDRVAQVGTQYHFTVRGVITSATETEFNQKLTAMRCRLHRPRSELRIRWSPDGVGSWEELYHFNSTSRDIDWGPKPEGLEIDRFMGGKAATYTWSCSVQVKECFNGVCTSSPAEPPTGVLCRSRHYHHAVDANGFTTRTVSGRLLVTGLEAAAGRSADYYRNLVAPKLPLNFKREAQSYQLSEDGRELLYSVTDREVMWTLPTPLTNGRASWMVRLRDVGAIVDLALAGRFEAPASVSKQQILQRIGELVLARFPREVIWDSRMVEEEVYENAVSFSFQAHTAASLDASDGTNWLDKFGATPPGYTGQAQQVGPYGGDGQSINSGVKAGSPDPNYDACVGNLASPKDTLGSQGATGYDDGSPKPPVSGTPATPGSNLSTAHLEAPYIAYHEAVSYEVDNHIVHFVPKVKGAAPVRQQTAVPTMVVIQAGYAIRDARNDNPINVPTPPPPALTSEQADVVTGYTEPVSGEPLGLGGQTRYKVSWRYVMRVRKSLEATITGAVDPKFPKDPRTNAAAAAFPAETIGALVVVPPS